MTTPKEEQSSLKKEVTLSPEEKDKPSLKWAAYIDGSNLYYAISDKHLANYWRVDVVKLCDSLLEPVLRKHPGKLVKVKYFIAELFGSEGEAQEEFERDTSVAYPQLFKRFKGHTKFDLNTRNYKEKGVDTRLASQLVGDLCSGAYDAALVISSDSDLAVAIEEALNYAPEKIIAAAHPDGVTPRYYSTLSSKKGFVGSILVDPNIYRELKIGDTLKEKQITKTPQGYLRPKVSSQNQ